MSSTEVPSHYRMAADGQPPRLNPTTSCRPSHRLQPTLRFWRRQSSEADFPRFAAALERSQTGKVTDLGAGSTGSSNSWKPIAADATRRCVAGILVIPSSLVPLTRTMGLRRRERHVRSVRSPHRVERAARFCGVSHWKGRGNRRGKYRRTTSWTPPRLSNGRSCWLRSRPMSSRAS